MIGVREYSLKQCLSRSSDLEHRIYDALTTYCICCNVSYTVIYIYIYIYIYARCNVYEDILTSMIYNAKRMVHSVGIQVKVDTSGAKDAIVQKLQNPLAMTRDACSRKTFEFLKDTLGPDPRRLS